jgi:hypothetical protein
VILTNCFVNWLGYIRRRRLLVDDQPTGAEEPVLKRDESAKRGMPVWVKIFLIIAIVLAVLIIVGLITGKVGPGGPHGPGRHLGFGLG